jgi:Flp pilus assembly protein TadG
MVEFALVLPLLLLLVLAMTDFGKAFNYWIDETHLANEGARLAAVNGAAGNCNGSPASNLAQYIQCQGETTELRSGGTSWLPAPARVCINLPTNPATGTSGNVGDPVQVTVTLTYNWLGFVAPHIGATRSTISGTSTMRLEAKPTTYSNGQCYPA